ncbi:hypothetical protein KSP39_PZI006774 [Platanthera zijinensis]|uniref:MATH domain-containing protein n=1 Tax=Platanthera zijinensis TaxID=2320716 RepID=A0AAP0BRQ8_9ASPA
MWFARLFSSRKAKQYSNRYAYAPTPLKGSGDAKKGESTGLPSEFTVKDSSAYDFLWTIKSFSKVTGDNDSRLASGRFESKGYSWKLILYPNGNIVNGQISLYLMLSRAASHPIEAVFKVSYELFLFDQNTGSTLSEKGENLGQVQDEMGFRSMIDLKTFRDSSNGYLVKDSCMFGVKILQMVPIQTPTECMHPVEKVSHDYSWKIENFSKLDKKTSHEKKFTAGDYLWSILIHPEGDQKSDIKVKGSNVSLYMYYHGSINDTSAMKVSAEFTLSIIDQIEGNHKKKTYTEVFKCAHPGWGRKDFIPLKDFNDPALGFIFNDTCIIEAKVTVLALVK